MDVSSRRRCSDGWGMVVQISCRSRVPGLFGFPKDIREVEDLGYTLIIVAVGIYSIAVPLNCL